MDSERLCLTNTTIQQARFPTQRKSVCTYHGRGPRGLVRRRYPNDTDEPDEVTHGGRNWVPRAKRMNIGTWTFITPNHTGATARQMGHSGKKGFSRSRRRAQGGNEGWCTNRRHKFLARLFTTSTVLFFFLKHHYFNKAFLNQEPSPKTT